MGQTIRRDAAAEDILADARTTLHNARSKGGDWKTLAEEHLDEVVTFAGTIEARRKTAADAEAPLRSALDTEDHAADGLLGRTADDVWNDLGRPAHDPSLAILFPGGISYYADGDVEHQPGRMRLLANLLDGGIVRRLPRDKARAYAEQIRTEAGRLEEKVTASAGPAEELAHLERIHVAIGRTAQVQLASLKRAYKSKGYSEADIHRVIPDRPTPPSRPKNGGGTGVTGGTT